MLRNFGKTLKFRRTHHKMPGKFLKFGVKFMKILNNSLKLIYTVKSSINGVCVITFLSLIYPFLLNGIQTPRTLPVHQTSLQISMGTDTAIFFQVWACSYEFLLWGQEFFCVIVNGLRSGFLRGGIFGLEEGVWWIWEIFWKRWKFWAFVSVGISLREILVFF